MNTTCPTVGRKVTRAVRFVGCAAFSLLLSGTLDAQIWTPGTTTTMADSYKMTPQNPLIRIRQRLPVGDTMTASFTSNGVVIANADGSIPGFSGTVGEGTAGISFAIAGIVNGQVVTDIYQTHTDPNLHSGVLQLAALDPGVAPEPGGLPSLGGWLQANGFSGTSMFQVPDFMSSASELHYAIDAVAWLDSGFAVPFDLPATSFDIVNGTSSALPGIVFSTSEFMLGSGGWASGDLYSGQVWIDSYHEMTTSPVPEPSTIGAGAALLGGLVLLIRRRRLREQS